MKAILSALSPFKWYIGGILLLAVVLFLVYRWGKKAGDGNTVVSDSGAVTEEDKQKAKTLARRLKDDINGLNMFGHDDSIYKELAESSNTVFALTLGEYKQQTGNSLVADMNGEVYGGWDVIDVIINRANKLNLS